MGTEQAKHWPGPEMASQALAPPKVKDPVVVLGWPASSRQKVEAAVDRIFSTPRGKEMEDVAKDRWWPIVIIVNNSKNHGQNELFHVIDIDPNYIPRVATKDGMQKGSLERVVAHEIGHEVMGTPDRGRGQLDNVRENENPVARALGQPERTKYRMPQ